MRLIVCQTKFSNRSQEVLNVSSDNVFDSSNAMKTLRRWIGIELISFLLMWVLSGHSAQAAGSTEAKRLFKNPPREYSTGPLWVWNDLLTEEQVRESLRDLAKQQVKQVWVHPRPGLMTPYLSSDWFRLWKVALQEAKRLDMNVWIYDENSYPSGFAGGYVPETMPESRGRGLFIGQTNCAPLWSTNLLGVYVLETNGAKNVTAKVEAGTALSGTNFLVIAEIRSTNAPWNGNRCYVNLLSPGVTERFLELTLEPYRREIGTQFGRRVPGVFTDEPNIHPAPEGWPWSETLAEEFQKRWGYDLLGHLPSLRKPFGDWRRIRHNYFQLLNDQFIERWSRPYHEYCQRYGLKWTGHYWDHDWPKCISVPDNMAMYAWHQTPAIDCLMNQYEENVDSQFGNVRMVKELSSVANQLGMKRTLCETYGAGGWDLRFEDMKRIGDWLEVLGVNTIDQHLSYITIRGARKRDHPQSFSYHEPWWRAYHISAEYLARLSAALSQGEQINSALVLEPTTTAWMYQGDDSRLKEIGKAFFELLWSLEAGQIEYDLGSEDVLSRHGSVSFSGLTVGRRDFQTVIVPPFMENMNAATVTLLQKFLGLGGTVLSCGPAPTRIDGSISDRGLALAASSRWKTLPIAGLPQMLSAKGFAIHRQAGDKGILFHNRRQLADGQLVFLVNTSRDSASEGVIESELSGMERWNLYTGKTERQPFETTSQGVRANFRLEPSGSQLLFLSRKPLKPMAADKEVIQEILPKSGPSIRRLTENVLTVDYVDIAAAGETKSNVYCFDANNFVWKQNGCQNGNPWDSAVQFGDELISKKFPASSGFEASYKFTIESVVPTNLAIVIERADLYSILCNGHPITAKSGDWWLDKAFRRLSIAAFAHVGVNSVIIKAGPLTMFHELEPAYVLGNFTLKASDRGFALCPEEPLRVGGMASGMKTNGWNSQGHPFYSGGVAYVERFEVKRRTGRVAVALPQWYGSVAEVTVNGRFAGYIDAPPWEREVTKWIRVGENQVEVTVIGTLKNTLGPHHGNPILGAAWPKRFEVGPNPGPPPGTNYSTVAYGLFQPFVLKQTTFEKPEMALAHSTASHN